MARAGSEPPRRRTLQLVEQMLWLSNRTYARAASEISTGDGAADDGAANDDDDGDADTNAFFFFQRLHWNFRRLDVAHDAALRRMFVDAAAGWLAWLGIAAESVSDAGGGALRVVELWASAIAPGQFHRIHSHLGGPDTSQTAISLVYYPRVPADHSGSAALVFDDPRPWPLGPPRCPRVSRHGHARLVYRPRAGELVAFPSWLPHGAGPVEAPAAAAPNAAADPTETAFERVAIAANVVVAPAVFRQLTRHWRMAKYGDWVVAREGTTCGASRSDWQWAVGDQFDWAGVSEHHHGGTRP